MAIWSAEIKDLEKLHSSFKGQYPKLDNELQRLIKTDDENIVLVYARRCLELIITDLSERELKRPRGTEPLKGIIDKLNREEKVPNNIIVSMQNLNSLSTFGAHPKDFEPRQVKPVLLDLTTVLEWYLKYMKDQESVIGEAGTSQGKKKEPASLISTRSRSGKRLSLVTGILLAVAIMIVSLIVFKINGVGKLARAGTIGSIIVLPFENYTGMDSLEYFVSGMHSSLIHDMGKIGSLHIPGVTTSKVYKNANKTIAQITKETKVDAALETAVLCLGEDSICFQTRLLKPGQEEIQLWTADYKVARTQILNWYGGVTKQIAKELNIKLTPEQERLLSKSRIIDREAYDNYMRSYQFLGDFSPESLNKARNYLNSAIEKDPDWAPLYMGLANVWMMTAQWGLYEPSLTDSIVFVNLNKALELDPDLPDAHYLIGWIAFVSEWDWAKAEREFLKALAINPNDALTRIWYSHLLCVLQRHDEALPQAQLAIDLDPLNPTVQLLFSTAQLFVNWCEADLTQINKILAEDPNNFGANVVLNYKSFYCGDYETAIRTEKIMLQTILGEQFDEDDWKEIERILDEKGYIAAYEKIVPIWEDQVNPQFVTPMDLAIAYTKANQYDKVLDKIEEGYKIRDHTMPYIVTRAYNFRPLYNNPRFVALVKKMDLHLPKSD